jgi:hypothetical protein
MPWAEQLAAALILGARDRHAASNVERARVNVQRRLKETIAGIAASDPVLSRYLKATTKTGTIVRAVRLDTPWSGCHVTEPCLILPAASRHCHAHYSPSQLLASCTMRIP